MAERLDAAGPLPIVLVHGAWAGAWVWDAILPLLAAANHRTEAVELPGNGSDAFSPAAASLELYVETVLAAVDRLGGRAALVGHSGGGVVISQAAEAAPDRIAALVYVAGIMLPNGGTFTDVVADIIADHPEASGIGPHLVWSNDRLTSRVPPDSAEAHFFHDVPPDIARNAALRLTPQGERGRAISPNLTAERFGSVPRLYVEAAQDRSVVPAAQRRMQDLVPGAEVLTIDTGHAPQLVRPHELVAGIVGFLTTRS